jgi:hypothetical protein
VLKCLQWASIPLQAAVGAFFQGIPPLCNRFQLSALDFQLLDLADG